MNKQEFSNDLQYSQNITGHKISLDKIKGWLTGGTDNRGSTADAVNNAAITKARETGWIQ